MILQVLHGWSPHGALNKTTEASGKHFSEALRGRPTAVGGGKGFAMTKLWDYLVWTWFGSTCIATIKSRFNDLGFKNLTKDVSIPCFSRNFEFRSLPPFFILTILNGFFAPPKFNSQQKPLVKPWWDWKTVKPQVGISSIVMATQIFFHVHPNPWGNDPIWHCAYFSDGWIETTN